MTRTFAGRQVVAALFLLLPTACVADPTRPSFEPECSVNQFRACETDACRGVQQCFEPGIYGHCACTVLDASYVKDAGGESDTGDESSVDSAPD